MIRTLILIFGFVSFGRLIAQTIPTPTQTDVIIIDYGTSGKADPNDRIQYKVTIQNTASPDATGVQLNIVPDPRTTFVAGSFRSSPLALNDAYSCTGNVGINVPAASGLKFNDFDDNIAAATITAGTFATTAGGSISIATDGGFTYTPLAGFTGADTYLYTLNDANGLGGVVPATDVATVTITVSNMIWFVNNTGGGTGGAGTLASPFKTLADFNASSGPAIGNVIYVQQTGTNYLGGIVLKNNQKLFGTGHTGGTNLANVLPFTMATFSNTLPAINGIRPVLTNSSGAGILLASNDTIRGIEAGTTLASDFAIRDNAATVGNLSIGDAVVNNATGGFRAGSGGVLSVSFASLSTSGGTNGINLTNCTGNFTISGGTISNPTGTAALISGGSVTFSSSGVITDNTGFAVDIDNHDSNNITFSGNITSTGTGIRVQNCGGGTKTFSGASKSLITTTNNAVTLSNNTGATINLTSGGLVISTTSGIGFNATGGGTVNVTDMNNTIASSTGTALNILNTTIGINNLNFRSISANGAVNGIVLNSTGTSGGLIVTGSGTADSGGTIQNTSGSGILVTNTHNLSLTRIKINNPGNHGIEANNLLGTCLLTNSTIMDFANAISNGFQIINDNANLAFLTISATTFNGTQTGNAGLLIEAQGTSNMVLSVENSCLFTDMFGDGIHVTTITGASGTINATVKNSTFNNAAAVGNGGILMTPFGGPVNFTFDIDGNTFDDIMRPTTNLGAINMTDGGPVGNGPTVNGTVRNNVLDDIIGSRGISLIADLDAGPLTLLVHNNTINHLPAGKSAIDLGVRNNVVNAKLTITNNNIGQNGALWPSGNANGILVLSQNASSANVLMSGNVVDGDPGAFELVRIRAINTSAINATVTGNDFQDTGASHVEFEAVTATGTPTMCVNISGNILPASGVGVIKLTESAGTMNVTQASSAAVGTANSNATVTVLGTPTFGQPACTLP